MLDVVPPLLEADLLLFARPVGEPSGKKYSTPMKAIW